MAEEKLKQIYNIQPYSVFLRDQWYGYNTGPKVPEKEAETRVKKTGHIWSFAKGPEPKKESPGKAGDK